LPARLHVVARHCIVMHVSENHVGIGQLSIFYVEGRHTQTAGSWWFGPRCSAQAAEQRYMPRGAGGMACHGAAATTGPETWHDHQRRRQNQHQRRPWPMLSGIARSCCTRGRTGPTYAVAAWQRQRLHCSSAGDGFSNTPATRTIKRHAAQPTKWPAEWPAEQHTERVAGRAVAKRPAKRPAERFTKRTTKRPAPAATRTKRHAGEAARELAKR